MASGPCSTHATATACWWSTNAPGRLNWRTPIRSDSLNGRRRADAAVGVAVLAGAWQGRRLAAWHWLREVERQRQLRSVADRSAQNRAAHHRTCRPSATLLMRMGRKQGPRTIWLKRPLGVAMLGRLDALHADGIPRESRDGVETVQQRVRFRRGRHDLQRIPPPRIALHRNITYVAI